MRTLPKTRWRRETLFASKPCAFDRAAFNWASVHSNFAFWRYLNFCSLGFKIQFSLLSLRPFVTKTQGGYHVTTYAKALFMKKTHSEKMNGR